ncbi:hypothetical protein AMTRI_Chr01g135950 [Amborella trichopoda]
MRGKVVCDWSFRLHCFMARQSSSIEGIHSPSHCSRYHSKTPSVKRLVLTSSITAVSYNRKPLTADIVVDETWFSEATYCK